MECQRKTAATGVLGKRNKVRDKGSIEKIVYVSDIEIAYRLFDDFDPKTTQSRLEQVYVEYKTSREESSSASNQALIALAILGCAYFGFVENFSASGISVRKDTLLHFLLMGSAFLTLRSGYMNTRASFASGIYCVYKPDGQTCAS